MDPIFEDYFRDRLEQLNTESLDFPSALRRWSDPSIYDGSVRSVLQAPELQERLRPDAQLLLQLAFTELVARPISAVRGPDAELHPKATETETGRRETESLPEAIQSDISSITFRAVDMKAHFEPVSAHDIVNATARMWRKLRTAQWDLWD